MSVFDSDRRGEGTGAGAGAGGRRSGFHCRPGEGGEQSSSDDAKCEGAGHESEEGPEQPAGEGQCEADQKAPAEGVGRRQAA